MRAIAPHRIPALLLICAALAAPAAHSAEPVLVADLNPETPTPNLAYERPGFFGDEALLLFNGATPDGSLWITDGSEEGTRPLAETCGYCFGGRVLGAREDGAFLVVHSGDQQGLWFTDGTARGTVLLDSYPGFGLQGEALSVLDPASGLLIYAGTGGGIRQSDGTRAGTGPLVGPAPEELGAAAFRFTAWGGKVFALVDTESSDWELWALEISPDGRADITSLVAFSELPIHPTRQVPAQQPLAATSHGLLFTYPAENGEELWRTDGTRAGTRRVTDVAQANGTVVPDLFVPAGSRYLFEVQSGGATGIWATDGTAAGTRLLLPGVFGELSEAGLTANGLRYFPLGPIPERDELWVSDGTAQGTRRIELPCEPAGCPLAITVHGGLGDGRVLVSGRIDGLARLYVAGPDGPAALLLGGVDLPLDAVEWAVSPEPGRAWVGISPNLTNSDELWETDGTPAGTRKVYEAPEFHELKLPVLFPSGTLWLLADKPYGRPSSEVLALTGGVVRVVERFERPTAGSDPAHFTGYAGAMVFVAGSGENADDLYALPAGAGEPVRLVNADPRRVAESVFFEPNPPVVAGASLYYLAAPEGERALSLWRVGPDLGPAEEVTSLAHGELIYGPFALGARIFWFAQGDDRFAPVDLWTSDGTAAGTRLLAPRMGPVLGSSDEKDYDALELGGRLYFLGADGRLHWTDGTDVGAIHLGYGEEAASSRVPMARLGNRLLFAAGGSVTRLWSTEGTQETTLPLIGVDAWSRPAAMGGRVYFSGFEEGTGYELWRTDGTPEGTARVRDLRPGWESSYPYELTVLGNRLYFSAFQDAAGRELWTSDGTAAGTRRVADLYPGPTGSSPTELAAASDHLVWSARRVTTGREMWALRAGSGTPLPVTDLWPGPGSSYPEGMTALGDRLFFSATGEDVGREPWWLPVSTLSTGCGSDPLDLCLLGGRVRVRVTWTDQRSGKTGVGTPVPFSDKTGLFWFFNEANIELVVKALDGTTINDHLWGFYGALSDVEYRVEMTDLVTGEVRVFENPAGEICGGADTTALPVDAAAPDLASRATETCQADAETLCLVGGRFQVRVRWDNQRAEPGEPDDAGTGKVIPSLGSGDNSGYFWFFNDANIELVVKALDGTARNGHYWFFYGALSDVEYSITVRDLLIGAGRTYINEPGNICGRADTRAFSD